MNEWLALLLAAPALGALVMTVFNLVVWPRGRPGKAADETFSILIPARDEEATIEQCVRSALGQPGVHEVLVYDDQSSDATPEILARLQTTHDRLRVVEAVPLPAGWVGKPHACHRLADAADSDHYFFVDADVELKEDAVARVVGLLADYRADALTAVPHQRVESFLERLVLPLLHLTYVSWLPLPLIWRTQDPRFLAANGQLMVVPAAVYDAVGGFAAVRDAVVDDMEFCRLLKREGHRVVFADGSEIAGCRMYESPGEVWEGFSKNIFEGIGSLPAFVAALSLYFMAFFLPWLLLALTPLLPALLPAALIGVASNILQRIVLVVRFDHPWESVITHPVAILAFFAIAVNSWLWHLRGAIRWSGRTYAKREARRG